MILRCMGKHASGKAGPVRESLTVCGCVFAFYRQMHVPGHIILPIRAHIWPWCVASQVLSVMCNPVLSL